jgi:hypothetical protein
VHGRGVWCVDTLLVGHATRGRRPGLSHMWASHGRARSLQSGPVHANLAAHRATEGLPAPAADLAADAAADQLQVGDGRGDRRGDWGPGRRGGVLRSGIRSDLVRVRLGVLGLGVEDKLVVVRARRLEL